MFFNEYPSLPGNLLKWSVAGKEKELMENCLVEQSKVKDFLSTNYWVAEQVSNLVRVLVNIPWNSVDRVTHPDSKKTPACRGVHMGPGTRVRFSSREVSPIFTPYAFTRTWAVPDLIQGHACDLHAGLHLLLPFRHIFSC